LAQALASGLVSSTTTQKRATLADRALRSDPIDETALGFLLRALTSLGRLEEGRRAYREYAQRLATELGIEPAAELRDLARRLELQRPAAAMGAPAASAPAESLVGRRIELARLGKLLAEPACRVLTVIGPGASARACSRGPRCAPLRASLPTACIGLNWRTYSRSSCCRRAAPARWASIWEEPVRSSSS
jgi:hypothetical protein